MYIFTKILIGRLFILSSIPLYFVVVNNDPSVFDVTLSIIVFACGMLIVTYSCIETCFLCIQTIRYRYYRYKYEQANYVPIVDMDELILEETMEET